MKKYYLIPVALFTMSIPAHAGELVSGYERQDGTYVQPYVRGYGSQEDNPYSPRNFQSPVPNQNVQFVPTEPVQQTQGMGIPPPPVVGQW